MATRKEIRDTMIINIIKDCPEILNSDRGDEK